VNLKDKVFEYIQKHGPQTNAELVTQFKVMKASMRRTSGDLVREGKLVPIKSADGCRYGLSADTREASKAMPEPSRTAPTTTPAPSRAKKKEEPPPDPKDWRMTDFTF
jgi:hypothetical protein